MTKAKAKEDQEAREREEALRREEQGGYVPDRPWMPRFLEAYGQNDSVTLACIHAGITRAAFYKAKQRDEQFAVQVADAHERAIDIEEAELRRRAVAGTPVKKTVTKTYPDGTVETTVTETIYVSTAALIARLRAHRPEKYRDRVEHGGIPPGEGGAPILVETPDEVHAAFDEAMRKFAPNGSG